MFMATFNPLVALDLKGGRLPPTFRMRDQTLVCEGGKAEMTVSLLINVPDSVRLSMDFDSVPGAPGVYYNNWMLRLDLHGNLRFLRGVGTVGVNKEELGDHLFVLLSTPPSGRSATWRLAAGDHVDTNPLLSTHSGMSAFIAKETMRGIPAMTGGIRSPLGRDVEAWFSERDDSRWVPFGDTPQESLINQYLLHYWTGVLGEVLVNHPVNPDASERLFRSRKCDPILIPELSRRLERFSGPLCARLYSAMQSAVTTVEEAAPVRREIRFDLYSGIPLQRARRLRVGSSSPFMDGTLVAGSLYPAVAARYMNILPAHEERFIEAMHVLDVPPGGPHSCVFLEGITMNSAEYEVLVTGGRWILRGLAFIQNPTRDATVRLVSSSEELWLHEFPRFLEGIVLAVWGIGEDESTPEQVIRNHMEKLGIPFRPHPSP